MSEQLQTIQGAGLLSSLINLFFKGLDKSISDIAEYEEEMGVLKQVNHFTLTDKKTKKEYDLTIKLSPVRNKDSVYYVEVQTNAPNLDISKLDKTAQSISNRNIKKYNDILRDLLNKSGYTTDDIADLDSDSNQNNEKTKDNKSDNESADHSDLLNIIKEVEDYYQKQGYLTKTANGSLVYIDIKLSDPTQNNTCKVTITGMGIATEADTIVTPPDPKFINLLDEKGNIKGPHIIAGDVENVLMKYLKKNKLSLNLQPTHASTNIYTTLLKEKDSNEISITAIKASCDVRSAMDVLCDLAENDDFVTNLIDDQEQSFVIVDEGENWVAEPIQDIDVSDSYCDLFKEVCIVLSCLNTYKWAVGEENWCADNLLCSCSYPIANLVDKCAVWVINHTDKFPNVIGTFGNDCTSLDELKENEQISLQKVHESAKALLEGLLEILDIYYVNLDHSEQKVIDDFVNEANRLLAYA